ncbi:hypothetical protein C4K68_21470 [Pokkaliibacter plantistimulans]|uniref:Uncharacterized protein n=1 Tax=Proteobacteria bacterium 228 TaxID=2083153 RepID=A0A2S5KK66_9PROT|nr:hypothetical protein C4K68_21470 [Pokkaliibacter plantistimulans]
MLHGLQHGQIKPGLVALLIALTMQLDGTTEGQYYLTLRSRQSIVGKGQRGLTGKRQQTQPQTTAPQLMAPQPAAAQPAAPQPIAPPAAHGAALPDWHSVGCLACHQTSPAQSADSLRSARTGSH